MNSVIDDEGHTALHWAAAMGRLKVVELLLQLGADVQRVNDQGQTSLMRAIMFTNNYDLRSFNTLVELLEKSLLTMDRFSQTVFHHIASTTSSRSKLAAGRYYFEVLLNKLMESHPFDQIGRMLDAQDYEGDTALTTCARNRARRCVRVLRRAGADLHIPNNHGRTAQDYLHEYERQRQHHHLITRFKLVQFDLSMILI